MSVQTSLSDIPRLERIRNGIPNLGLSRRRSVYVWAFSRRLAQSKADQPSNRYPRYVHRRDAISAWTRGDDGFPGERLYRVSVKGV